MHSQVLFNSSEENLIPDLHIYTAGQKEWNLISLEQQEITEISADSIHEF